MIDAHVNCSMALNTVWHGIVISCFCRMQLATLLMAPTTPCARRFWHHARNSAGCIDEGLAADVIGEARSHAADAVCRMHPTVTNCNLSLVQKLDALPQHVHAAACEDAMRAHFAGAPPCLLLRACAACPSMLNSSVTTVLHDALDVRDVAIQIADRFACDEDTWQAARQVLQIDGMRCHSFTLRHTSSPVLPAHHTQLINLAGGSLLRLELGAPQAFVRLTEILPVTTALQRLSVASYGKDAGCTDSVGATLAQHLGALGGTLTHLGLAGYHNFHSDGNYAMMSALPALTALQTLCMDRLVHTSWCWALAGCGALTSLTALSVSVPECLVGMGQFAAQLRSLSKLQRLSMELRREQTRDADGLAVVRDSLLTLAQLSALQLSVTCYWRAAHHRPTMPPAGAAQPERATLAALSALTNLHSVAIRCTPAFEQGSAASALAQWGALTCLHKLAVDKVEDVDSARTFASCLADLAALRALSIGTVGHQLRKWLGTGLFGFTTLQELCFGHGAEYDVNSLAHASTAALPFAQQLAAALPRHSGLTKVQLSNMQLCDRAAGALAKSLASLHQLRDLLFTNNCITVQGGWSLVLRTAALPHMQLVDLRSNKLGRQFKQHVQATLPHATWVQSRVVVDV